VDRQSIFSTRIAGVGYDPAQRLLEIEFHKGGVYQYPDTPEHIYQGLTGAYSPGSFFDEHIAPLGNHQRVGSDG
jgi:hypothetical protein